MQTNVYSNQLGWSGSLAVVGIYFLFILIINLLAGIWGYYGSCVSVGSGSLFSILLLCRIMDIAYCMAITLISSNVCLMFILVILNIVSIFFIEGVCVASIEACNIHLKVIIVIIINHTSMPHSHQ